MKANLKLRFVEGIFVANTLSMNPCGEMEINFLLHLYRNYFGKEHNNTIIIQNLTVKGADRKYIGTKHRCD